ncbi:hypothetical protein [Flavobacterium sp. HSC-61S13]|uniref:hypothetical protein n=1 Tax=Flavobacterium sp. HSC-61S13 TaxID=2910963 RepID=UPI00209CAA2B|nr:hypothetical protein [Flavobacterium sp. HSC-61S13]MCP1995307.1 plasmid maintenance system antidote protein VapI [Flavobacterium sp. HSC-61S13]
MKNQKEIEKYSPEELVEAVVFKNPIPKSELKEAAEELAEARKDKRKNQSDNQVLYSKMLQLRFLMEDYTASLIYDENQTFASFLKSYIKLLYKTNKDFAEDIDLKQTELSLILNEHRLPTAKMIVRLEIHSNNAIPALSWSRLVEKQREYKLENDIEFKQEQKKFVKNCLEFENVI